MLSPEAICKRVKKFELKKSKEIKYDHPFISTLDGLLLDVYGMLQPQPSAYEQRQVLVQMFNQMAKEIFGSENGFPIVEAFGSFVMDLFTERSDLDLSLNFNDDYTIELPRDKKIASLRKFSKHLYAQQAKRCVRGVNPVLKARVPVLKVVDCSTGIECDISVENKDGISRTLILKIISSIDGRFRILSYLMKVWAKAHGINSSKDRTMNSLTIISLVAFHLQTRDPPILPPFSAILKDGTDTSCLQNAVLGFRNFGDKNKESISELFLSLFCKLSSTESLWPHGLCASTYDGSWISKKWKSGIAHMSVEDFLDRAQNFARAVAKAEMKKINKCIQGTLNDLLRSMKGQTEVPKLKNQLFRSILLKISSNQVIPSEGTDHKRKAPLHRPKAAPLEPIKKKLRSTEATWSKDKLHSTEATWSKDKLHSTEATWSKDKLHSTEATWSKDKLSSTEASWSKDNSLPASTILRSSFAPLQPSIQLPLGSLSVPCQSGYELHLQRHSVASHHRPQHQLGPIPSQHHPQHSVASHHRPQHQLGPIPSQHHPQHSVASHPRPQHQLGPIPSQQHPQYSVASHHRPQHQLGPIPSQHHPQHSVASHHRPQHQLGPIPSQQHPQHSVAFHYRPQQQLGPIPSQQQPQHSFASKLPEHPSLNSLAPNHPQHYLQHPSACNHSHLQHPQYPFNPNLSQHQQHQIALKPSQESSNHPFAPNFPSQYPHHRPNPGQQYPQRPITPNLGHLPQAPQRPFTHFDYELKHQPPAIPPRVYNG